MTALSDISAFLHGILQIIFTLLLLISMIDMIVVVSTRANASYFLISLILLVFGFVFLRVLIDAADVHVEGNYGWFGHIPALLMFLIVFLYACVSIGSLLHLIRWKNSHITQQSIKESIDMIPTGLCYYLSGGMPILVNHKMTELCLAITGQEVLNAEQFWNKLLEVSTDGNIIRLSDDSFYSFSRKRLSLEDDEIYELIATNVTTQYRPSQKLKEENIRLEQMNRRLRKYNQNVEEVTREQEMLAAKVRIHDQIGHLLLSTKRVLSMNSEIAEREKILRLWQQDTTLLIQNPSQASSESIFCDLADAAASLGITILYDGDLPRSGLYDSSLLMLIIHECLTNAFSHAHATELYIDFDTSGEVFHICCSNNGKVPENPIIEGGGLSNLRRHVEDRGGSMVIRDTPVFELSITLPKGGEDYFG